MLKKLIGYTVLWAIAITISSCHENNKNTIEFYLGTYSSADEPGIYNCKYNIKTQDFEVIEATFGIKNPSFLTLSPDSKYLYSVGESADFASSNGEGFMHIRLIRKMLV